MDTFLGRTKNITNVTDNIIPTISGTNYDSSMFESQEYLNAVDPEDPNDI